MTATPEGTRARAKRSGMGSGFYRTVDGLELSTIGMGSYLGDTDADAREAYQASAKRALERGVTVLDTASNYRHQASERDLGAALDEVGDREGVFVTTKGGFVHGDVDADLPPRRYLEENYLDPGVVDEDDVVQGLHCLAPAFLRGELENSLENLGVDAVDLYLVHNPQTQLGEVPNDEVYARLEGAFLELERQRDDGTLEGYGIATWDGLRTPPGEEGHLSLQRCLEAAREAAERVDRRREDHGFRGVQLPFNMHLVEASAVGTQRVDGRVRPALEAIHEEGLIALTSASLMQGGLLGRVTEQARELMGVDSDVAAGLQFARSAPGVTSALVGMGSPEHVTANLDALKGLDPDPDTVEQLLDGIEQQGRK
jgi:aryl-alcohol dehydrogenase-like predicted oxidoreductase